MDVGVDGAERHGALMGLVASGTGFSEESPSEVSEGGRMVMIGR